MKKRNGIISLWKFIFSILIVLFHCYRLYPNGMPSISSGGYIAVEFFYVVSGYYLAYNFFTKKKKVIAGKETIFYVWNFIKKLIPYILISYIILIIIIIVFDSFGIKDLINSIWYPLLFRQLGFNTLSITNHLWYITSFIISIMIIYPLLIKYKKEFTHIASPLIVLLGLGYLNHNYGTTLEHSYSIWENFYYTGTLRAFIEINIGIIIYELSKGLKKFKFTNLGKNIITILGEVFLIIVFLIALFFGTKGLDYILLLMLSISILFITTEQTKELKFMSNKFTSFLEKISMPIYINHIFIIILFWYLKMPIMPELQSLIVVGLTITFSIIEHLIIEYLKKRKLINKLGKLIIKS